MISSPLRYCDLVPHLLKSTSTFELKTYLFLYLLATVFLSGKKDAFWKCSANWILLRIALVAWTEK